MHFLHNLNGGGQRNDNKMPMIKNALMKQARELNAKAIRALKNNDRDGLLQMQGQLQGYVDTRRAIAPYLPREGYTREVEGRLNKIKQALATLDAGHDDAQDEIGEHHA